MSACLSRQLLGPHVGDGRLPQPLLADAHLHHHRHQIVEILSSQGTDFIVSFALDFLPSHGAFRLERGGLDVLQELVGTSVTSAHPDGPGKAGIDHAGGHLNPF